DVPQHVLRFWESRFAQLKPLKRGGGRRYYRPEDIELLRRIKNYLYKQGYTIKGVQRLLRERGGGAAAEFMPTTAPVSDMGTPMVSAPAEMAEEEIAEEGLAEEEIETGALMRQSLEAVTLIHEEIETGQILDAPDVQLDAQADELPEIDTQ